MSNLLSTCFPCVLTKEIIDIVQEGSYTSVNGEEVELLNNEPIKRVLEKLKTYLLSSTLYL